MKIASILANVGALILIKAGRAEITIVTNIVSRRINIFSVIKDFVQISHKGQFVGSRNQNGLCRDKERVADRRRDFLSAGCPK